MRIDPPPRILIADDQADVVEALQLTNRKDARGCRATLTLRME